MWENCISMVSPRTTPKFLFSPSLLRCGGSFHLTQQGGRGDRRKNDFSFPFFLSSGMGEEEENGRNRVRRLLASSQEEKGKKKPCFLFAPTFLPFFPNASLRKIGGKRGKKSFRVETLPLHFLFLLFFCISTIFSPLLLSFFACVRKSANLMTFGLVQILVLFSPFVRENMGGRNVLK